MLSDDLANQLQQSNEATPDVMAITQRLIDDLKSSEIERNSLTVGDKLPAFELPNAVGDTISSDELLKKGHLIISFYRGSWCPLCNLELRAYQTKLNEIRALNADLLAVTPESPDRIEESDAAISLDFEVLTDHDNQLARKFGLVFQLPKEMLELYETFGIDIAAFNGTDVHELPVPATYVVNRNGMICFAFIDANYLIRAEPNSVIKVLQGL